MNQAFKQIEDLGDCDITLGGFRLWCQSAKMDSGFTFLDAFAICESENSLVCIDGTFLVLEDIKQWVLTSENIHAVGAGAGSFHTLDSLLHIDFEIHKTGTMTVDVHITPDIQYQKHSFIFDLDQTYLLRFIEDCRSSITRITQITV